MKILSQLVAISALALCGLSSHASAQSSQSACLPVDARSRGLRDDFAAMASDTTAMAADDRELYHLPVAKDHQVRQEVADALCSKAIEAIRSLVRTDGTAPSRVYLFQVKNVWVVTPGPGNSMSGVVWTFDAAMQTFLGGVLQ